MNNTPKKRFGVVNNLPNSINETFGSFLVSFPYGFLVLEFQSKFQFDVS